MNKIKIKNDDFLKIKETLTRMGIANSKDKILYQSCHILSKQNEYYIVHFKEMLSLDGVSITLDEEDKVRLDSITQMLENWNMLEIIDRNNLSELTNNFRIITFKDKGNWKLIPKYTIGK